MDQTEAARLARVERQLAYLYRHLGLDPAQADAMAPQFPPQFAEAIRGGNLIEAIKIYREVTGVGLREAKDAVDAIARGGTRY